MTFANLNGERVTAGRLVVPTFGIWSANVAISSVATLPKAVTLTIGDLVLVGSVFRSASFAGARSALIVGGADGWRLPVPSQSYRNTAGVRASMVLRDAAAAVGETVVLAQDRTLGLAWTREQAPASRVLRQVGGSIWWMDAQGRTQVGPRPTSPIASKFDVLKLHGAAGLVEIATETYADWLPGRTFTAPTVPTAQKVSLTAYTLDNEGKVRLAVLTTGFANAA